MISQPLCEFHSSQVMRNKNKKNPDDNTHIPRLIIICNYLNAPTIAHSVYHIDNMVNTAYTSREDKRVADTLLLEQSGKIQKVHSILISSTCL